jgi:hypothetical protein
MVEQKITTSGMHDFNLDKRNMIHPWLSDYPIKPESQYLILGTHPPMPYNGKLKFYYGNMSEFWRFLDLVYPGHNLYLDGFPKTEDIISFLDKIKTSITDIIYKTNLEQFSTDGAIGKINPKELNPFLSKWLKESKVETIYFTSFGGTNSAKNLFKRWYKKEFEKPSKISKEHVNYVQIFNRKVKLVDLFSPSPTARRSSPRIKEFKEWRLGKEVDNDFDHFRVDWYKQYLPKL